MRIPIAALGLSALVAAAPSLIASPLTAFTYTNTGTSAYTTSFIVVTSGTYSLQVEGAAGGTSAAYSPQSGGNGANITGDLTLTAGEVLDITIGAKGTNQGSSINDPGSTGGGGTYVTIGGVTLLIDAGGGGGAGAFYGGNSANPTSTSGGGGTGSSAIAGGSNGGNGGSGSYGKGGDGYNSGNENAGSSTNYYGYQGGSGGGGYSGGGGGGYIGAGGGGGSYTDTPFITSIVDGSGDTGGGIVTLDLLQSAATPEPSSLVLLLSGALAAGIFGYRRTL